MKENDKTNVITVEEEYEVEEEKW